ncbi:MAG: malonic semialdehyde reductase [Polyangiaceae bacterium]
MPPIDDLSLHQLFLDARTHVGWLPQPIEDATLHRLYDILKMAPTSANSQPVRILFVKSPEAKERLRPCLSPGNVDKTMAAPATAIVAVDRAFHEKMPKLFPQSPGMAKNMEGMPDAARDTFLMQNGSLQGAYLILAARALGLDCGPMGGFDKAKVDAAFFEGSTWRSILLVNLGHGDPAKLHPRNPRLDFEEACRIE